MKNNDIKYRVVRKYSIYRDIWYFDPQVKCKFLWWNYWSSITGLMYSSEDKAKYEIWLYKEKKSGNFDSTVVYTESYTETKS